MMAFGLALLFLGYMLIYAGVHRENPWDEVVAAFGGERSEGL